VRACILCAAGGGAPVLTMKYSTVFLNLPAAALG
jgi:hypothetical protein